MVRDRKCTPEEAVVEVRALRDRIMSVYLRLRDEVSVTARPELRRYVHEIGYWIRGHIIWADSTVSLRRARTWHGLPASGNPWMSRWWAGCSLTC